MGNGIKTYGYAGLYWQSKFSVTTGQMDNISAQIGHMETDNRNLDYGERKGGYFQFQVGYKDGKPRGFQTAINRYENLITGKENGLGMDKSKVPTWLHKAREHDDPSKLSRSQQEELLMANLAMQSGSDDSIRKALQTGDAGDLWLDFHYGGEEKEDRSMKWNKKAPLAAQSYQTDLMGSAMTESEKLQPSSGRRPSYRSIIREHLSGD